MSKFSQCLIFSVGTDGMFGVGTKIPQALTAFRCTDCTQSLARTRQQTWPIGNKLGTGLAILAQCDYKLRAVGQNRNCFAIKAFKYHRNVFPIRRIWQTYRTQNPVLVAASL